MENGKNIRAARIYRGITQEQLGKLCGLATGTIQQYELNKRNPKIEQVAKIADALRLGYSVSSHGVISFHDFVDAASPDPVVVDFNNQQLSSISTNERDFMQKEMQKVIRDGISMNLSENEFSIVSRVKKLNNLGQSKAIEQIELLTKIPEYRKDEDSDKNADNSDK